jgi:hypothetical protein
VTGTTAEIDRIVREVLAELRAGERELQGPRAKPQAPDQAVCVVAERVVTLAAVEGRLDGAAVVRVRSDAVVTPAVRDELKTRNIRLEVVDGSDGAAADMTRVVAAIANVGGEPGALEAAVRSHLAGIAEVRLAPEAKLTAAVWQIGKAVIEGNSLGVVLTSRPIAAAGLANRIRGVRAAWACDVQSVNEAATTFAANLLTYNPARHATFEQRAMLREFVRRGVPECPAEFER